MMFNMGMLLMLGMMMVLPFTARPRRVRQRVRVRSGPGTRDPGRG